MNSIGLDVGTGFVKCVSDTRKVRFPSLYAYKIDSKWAEKPKIVEGVGDDAVGISHDPDAIVIRPVMLGRPVHEEAFARLVSHAVMLTSERKDATGATLDDIALVVGLPYGAARYKDIVKRMIVKRYRPVACDVLPQVLGTLVDAELESGIVVSIGQGTTEIVIFENNKTVRGRSVHHAVDFISSRIGSEMSYLDNMIYSNPAARRLVNMLADSILNNLQHTMQDLERLPVIVSGGGILVPGMKEAFVGKLGNVIVPKDPVMSNAKGLYKVARSFSAQVADSK